MKSDIVKNILDIECNQPIQKLSAIYIALSVGLLSFVATWVYKPEFQAMGMILTFSFILIMFDQLDRTKLELKNKLEEIKKLE